MSAELVKTRIPHLDALLLDIGLQKTWMKILATELSTSSRFEYILKDKLFRGIKPLNESLLLGLSIGEIGVLYEYSVAHVDHSSRKGEGQFFTPDDIAEFLVTQTQSFPEGVWMDPCSGIGNLSWHLVNSKKDPEEFLLNQMILMDKDNLALTIARVLFTMSFQNRHEDLFHKLEKKFIEFDFLSVASNGEFLSVFEGELGAIPRHDYVLVNPPYLAVAETDFRFELATCKDLYGYFLENIMKTSKGFVSITPQSFTNAGKFEGLRAMMLSKFPVLKIYNFDNIPGNIFFGFKFGSQNSNTANSIRVAITVAKEGKKSHKITSLLRWRTSERHELLANIDRFLSRTRFTSSFFPKVSSVFSDLYESVFDKPTLGDLIFDRATEFALHVPSSPRYFISALRSPVSRTSLRTIYFKTGKDRDTAYLLLNSSYMYWWWRVRDGGMTLALETIRSLPILNFELNRSLIQKLVKSETNNRVFKTNAGAEQENVKHPLSLVSEINRLVCPEFADALLLTHENSELVQLNQR